VRCLASGESDVILAVATDAKLHADAKEKAKASGAIFGQNVLFIEIDSVSEFDQMGEPSLPESLAAGTYKDFAQGARL